MALRPTKPKKKKNPFRLSSDRQPEIAKANERRTPGSRKLGPMLPKPPKRMIPLGPRKGIPPGMGPYKPFPKKGIEEIFKKIRRATEKNAKIKINSNA